MSSATWYRMSGLALLIGGPIGVIQSLASALLFPGHHATAQQMSSFPWLLLAYMYLVAFLLLTGGLPGMYRSQAAKAGIWGVIGFWLTLIGNLVGGVLLGLLLVLPSQQGSQSSGASGPPSPAVYFLIVILPVLPIATGAVLLGIASLRAKVFPAGASILLLAAGAIGLISLVLPSPFDDILETVWNCAFFLAFAWYGAALLWQGRKSALAPGVA